MTPSDTAGPRKSELWITRLARLLVVLQFGLAAWIFLSTPWMDRPRPASLFAACSLLVAGGVIAIWAWWVMGLSRLRIMPHPARRARLLCRGPYRYIRHPMYAGLLLAGLGGVLWHATVLRTLVWLCLVGVLACKTHIEEQLLRTRFSDYDRYASRTWRYFPGLW